MVAVCVVQRHTGGMEGHLSDQQLQLIEHFWALRQCGAISLEEYAILVDRTLAEHEGYPYAGAQWSFFHWVMVLGAIISSIFLSARFL